MEMDASDISSVEWINLKVKLNGLTWNGRIETIITLYGFPPLYTSDRQT